MTLKKKRRNRSLTLIRHRFCHEFSLEINELRKVLFIEPV